LLSTAVSSRSSCLPLQPSVLKRTPA
jgi:hypothetical protein